MEPFAIDTSAKKPRLKYAVSNINVYTAVAPVGNTGINNTKKVLLSWRRFKCLLVRVVFSASSHFVFLWPEICVYDVLPPKIGRVKMRPN